MNRMKLLICIAFAAVALTACTKEDNPVTPVTPPETYAEAGDSTGVNVDNPHELPTDQPAYAPGL